MEVLIYWSLLMPRGRPIVTPLTLTPEQVTSLTQIANSRTAEHRQVQRARILLGAASGKPQKKLAEEAKLSVSAVARFLRKALQIGPMMALEDLKRSGRSATISDDARTWVRSLACTPPKDLPGGPTQALWSMETLAVYVRKHAEEHHLRASEILCPWDNRSPPNGCIQ